jgi:hypothetical protein
MPRGRTTVHLDARGKALEAMVQAADAMEAGRAHEVTKGASGTKMIEQATLRGRQDENEIIEGQGHRDRHAGDQLSTPRQAIEPRLKKPTHLAKARRERDGGSPALRSERLPDLVSQHGGPPADVAG